MTKRAKGRVLIEERIARSTNISEKDVAHDVTEQHRIPHTPTGRCEGYAMKAIRGFFFVASTPDEG